jgi:hypothetical protein
MSYGGNISAEDVELVPDEGITVQAVTYIQDKTSS